MERNGRFSDSHLLRPPSAEMVPKDTRFGNAILAIGDSRIEHQLQKDVAVQKERPGNRDLGLHARLESIVRGKNDVFTAHHYGLAEAVQRSVFGCGFVTQRQWDRVPASWPLGRRSGAVALRRLSLHPPPVGNPEWVHSGPAA
jgi:hypothetical protein